jgi:branched-chain amino acid transport system permease protein
MSFNAFLFQAVDGLAAASGLFFVAAGLSLIFGVTRIVNIAHGSLYMIGTYIAYTFATRIGGAFGFWGGIVATALLVGALGALIEVVLLRRIYRAPELFQLLATFALVLVINDATLWLWGPAASHLRYLPDFHRSVRVVDASSGACADAVRQVDACGDTGS